MINQQLLDYVRALLRKNMKDREMRDALIGAGWQVSDVEAAFDAVRRELAAVKAKERRFRIITAASFLFVGIIVFITATVLGFRKRSGQAPPPFSPEFLKLFEAFPESGASASERQAYIDFVEQHAVRAEAVEFTNCVASPSIVALVADKPFVFVNRDPKSHILQNADAMQSADELPTEGQLEVLPQTSPDNTPYIIRQLCDGAPSGLYLIMPDAGVIAK